TRGFRLIAEVLELRGHGNANGWIVLHHEDRLISTVDRDGRIGGAGTNLLIGARQINLERRALAFLAVEFDMAARLLDETVNHRKPEAGAFADLFGGEERLEYFLLDGRGNSGPGVAHREHNVRARHHLAVSAGVFLVEMDI